MEEKAPFYGERSDSHDEETRLLVPTEGKNKGPAGSARSFDDALEGVGVGVFHLILILVAGWALASDSVEVQCISFVTPQIDRNESDPSQKVVRLAIDSCECVCSVHVFKAYMYMYIHRWYTIYRVYAYIHVYTQSEKPCVYM